MRLSGKKNYTFIIFLLFIVSYSFSQSKYVVQKGDTLYSISKQKNVTVDEIQKANNLTKNDVIKVGQTLIIPDKKNASSSTQNNTQTKATKNYTIAKGDTLFGIAKKNQMTLDELLSLNKMDKNSVIKIGQVIKIYSNSNSSSTNVATKTNDNKTLISLDSTKPLDTRTYGKTQSYDSSIVWPVKNPTITKVEGKVNGVQLVSNNDDKVTCIREGSVMYIGLWRGLGQIIFVQSKTGLIYSYAGVNNIKVKKGDYVLSGNQLGTVGKDPINGKNQITFMVFQNGQPIDPAKAPRN